MAFSWRGFFWRKWGTLENEKMGPYLKASSQEEGFNREFKGLPLNVWQTPVSVGIWEKSILEFTSGKYTQTFKCNHSKKQDKMHQ